MLLYVNKIPKSNQEGRYTKTTLQHKSSDQLNTNKTKNVGQVAKIVAYQKQKREKKKRNRSTLSLGDIYPKTKSKRDVVNLAPLLLASSIAKMIRSAISPNVLGNLLPRYLWWLIHVDADVGQ